MCCRIAVMEQSFTRHYAPYMDRAKCRSVRVIPFSVSSRSKEREREMTRLRMLRALTMPLLVGATLLAGGYSSAQAACQLTQSGKIKHIVYLQFDNVHLRRDNPNVPSDLEQVPNLLNFLEQ